MVSELGAEAMNFRSFETLTPCILDEVDKHLEGSHCHQLRKSQGASDFSEGLVTLHQTLKPSISQENTLKIFLGVNAACA